MNEATPAPSLHPAHELHPRYLDYLQPALIALLALALALGPTVVLERLAPAIDWRWLPPLAFMTALEAALTSYWLASGRHGVSKVALRVAELVTILILVRLVTWLLVTPPPQLQGLQDYLLQPGVLVDGIYGAYAGITLFAWERATRLAGIFASLRPDDAEIAFFSMSGSERERMGWDAVNMINRTELSRSFLTQWLVGGLVLALFAAVSTFDLASMRQPASGIFDLTTITRLGLDPRILSGLLLYFVTGLWLASQARMAVMRSRWMANQLQVDPALHGHWQRYVLTILLGAAVVASFLPIGSTIALSRILQAIAGVVVILTGIILTVVTILYVMILRFILGGETASEQPPLGDLPTAGGTLPLAEGSNSLALLLGTIFWAVVAIVAGFAIYYYLRQRQPQLNFDLFSRLWQRIVDRILSLRKSLSKGVSAVRSVGLRKLPKPDAANLAGLRPPRFLKLRSLSARDQIRYFYLSIVRRADDKGLHRRKSDTPLEFSERLQHRWPEADEDIDQLTHAFLRARYGAEDIEPEEVNPVKAVWKRVRAFLRSAR
ncbi:MAG: DUF4129 domain-containing protein [Candidatus Promineifilaceae bacterium]|nr:DUF4129 domain-containing protein [Candidatus Promineifilaceae bacterium]